MTVWPNGTKTIPRVTSEWGPRAPVQTPAGPSSSFHRGIDLVGWANNKSPCAGVVIFAAYNGGAGNMITIRADNGDTFVIMHNARFLVSKGQRVAEGQDVGVMGTTGASTGVHCHFECHPGGGTDVNPRIYMAAAIGNNPAGGGATPLPNQGEEDMTYALVNRVPDNNLLPTVPAGAVFVGNGTDPMVWVSNWGPEMINGVVLAEWDAKSIAERITQVGLRGSGVDINNVYKSMADAIAKKPAYTLGGGTVNVGDINVPSDPKLLAAVQANTAALGELLKATKALNPPG